MSKQYHRILSIAGSDSGGGAGIQADLKTFSALDCFGMSAITALTAQNTLGVQQIQTLPVDFVQAQIKSVIDDIGVDAIKIGMLERKEIVVAVAESLKNTTCPIVLDPVMIAKGGASLILPDAIEAMCDHLFPFITLLTPNIPEAEYFLNTKINSIDEMKSAAIAISKLGAKNILIKGGHSHTQQCCDVLYQSEKKLFSFYKSKRIHTQNTHGTGCTLSAAIAAELGKQTELALAVSIGKKFLTRAIRLGKSYKTGQGHGPVNHFK